MGPNYLSAITSTFNVLFWGGIVFSLLRVWDFSCCSSWMLPGHVRGTLSRGIGGCAHIRETLIYPLPFQALCLFLAIYCFPVTPQWPCHFLERKACSELPSLCTSRRKRLRVWRLCFKKENILLLPMGSWLPPLQKETFSLCEPGC